MQGQVYLNGEFVDYGDARVPIEDRGYLFGDGVYEVIRIYGGQPFAFREHFVRLGHSAEAVLIDVDVERLERDARELVRRNPVAEAIIYIQVTRGASPRNHAFPTEASPTSMMFVRPITPLSEDVRRYGVACITVPDDRWSRCYIKSINLLSNVLAKEQAVRAGCFEAIYARDGFVTEGSSSNVYAVFDNVLWTAPKTNYILGGITRDVILDLARSHAVEVREEPFALARLFEADEVLISSTTAEVLAAVTVDGRTIGAGQPGPIASRLYGLFQGRVRGEN